jgi:hypothetical protein
MIAPDFTSPQSVNRYGYALGNPLRYIDPSGNIPFCAFYGNFVCSYIWPDSGANWINRVSAALSVRLQFTSDELSRLLSCVTGHCKELDYCPSDNAQQAMGIVRDWFFETGTEMQYFGPDEPVTQELMYDFGVERFRQEWALASYRLPYPTDEDDANLINGNGWWHYDIDESGGEGGIVWAFVCENVELAVSLTGLGSMTPQGPVDALGGVLGSYAVRVEEMGFGMAKFIVYNETGWASGTRVGNLGSLIQNRPRDKWGPGGTVKQQFHWYEPIPM